MPTATMENWDNVPPEKTFKKLRNWFESNKNFNCDKSTIGTGTWARTLVRAKIARVNKSLLLSFGLEIIAWILFKIFSITSMARS